MSAPAPYPATARQMDLLRFIVGYQEAHRGVSPTLRQMGLGIGQRAEICRTGCYPLLAGLQERGWIVWNRFQAGAIEALHTPAIPRSPDCAPLYFVHPEPVSGRGAAHVQQGSAAPIGFARFHTDGIAHG